MKKSSLLFSLLFVSFISFSQEKAVSIRFIQNGKTVEWQNGIVRLEKKPFQIEIALTNVEGIYLNASLTDDIYRLNFDQPIPDFKELPSMVMAEKEFNPDQELTVDGESWSYWFYNKNESSHRFDKHVKVDGTTVTGTKTIKQFFINENKKTIAVEKLNKPLYLVFETVEKDKDGNPSKEVERTKLQIIWN